MKEPRGKIRQDDEGATSLALAIQDSAQGGLVSNGWSSGWIGVDLDGTLAEYHGWKGKDYSMVELWDDRAVQVETNTGLRVDGKP